MYEKVKQKYKYEQDIINSLTTLEESSPREFLKTFKPLRELDASYKEIPMPPSQWVTHFQTLLNIKPEINTNFDHAVKKIGSQIPALFLMKLISRLSQSDSQSLKSSGVLNEMIKCSWSYLSLHLLHMFNIILTQAKFPASWNINTLTPLHKKGSINVRDNYRGIAVSKSIAKSFFVHTSQALQIVPHNQIGYKKGM